MSGQTAEHLQNYIEVRTAILSRTGEKQNSFLLSQRGNRLCGNSIIDRLHKLKKLANINKTIGLHSLRHSIATHLLQSGMKLEEVSNFLGHSSLESTQVYTQVVNC